VNYPEVLAYLHAQGFYVGNHSVTHPLDPPLTKLSDAVVRQEIGGGVPSTLFRPPGNYFDARIQHIANQLGYQLCSYTVDTKDYTGLPAKAIVKEVLADTQPGGVVLMHMLANSHALEALPGIINGLRAKGFNLCQAASGPTGERIPGPLTC
jgi:peptidoglycan/xylan/chitin deacetylase (PgdA/CDA1 family)